MSTDDLTRRARAAARGLKPTLSGTSALLSELADEADRLREACDEWRRHFEATRDNRDHWRTHAEESLADLDAARAALGRVRDLNVQWREAQAANRAALARGEWTPRDIPLPDDYDRALGES